ncbi:MAG: hypothetical protein U0R19_39180 [Bryobacteraceae bacterium]
MKRMMTLAMVAGILPAIGADICNRQPAPEPLTVAWAGLETAGLTLEVANRRLTADVRNKTTQRVVAEFLLKDTGDGVTVESKAGPVTVDPGQLVQVAVNISGHARNFSGQLELAYVARGTDGRGVGEGEAATLYYHPTSSGRHLVYGASVMRRQFDNGNFRGVTIPGRLENQRAIQSLLAARGAVSAAEGGVSEVAISGQPQASPGMRRFCAWMPVSAYRDASPRNYNGVVTDYGEDYGRDGVLPMGRALMIVSHNGATLFSNYVDASGCSPYFAAAPNSGYTVSIAAAGYTGAGTNRLWYVSDANQNDEIPVQTIPNVNAGVWGTVILTMPTNVMPLVVYAAAAANDARFPSGNNNSTFEYWLRESESNAGTATDYHNGHPRIKMKYVLGALRSKFTIGHEFGHAVVINGLVPQVQAADIDYIDGQHTNNSTEWQLVAALEGFANFVSARVWNDGGVNADGVFVIGANVDPATNVAFPMNTFDKYFETTACGGGCPEGKGIERDWAQFFWKLHTAGFGGNPAVSTVNLVSWWKSAYPWPKQEGFFSDFSGAYLALFGPATYGNYVGYAVAAGVAH